MKLTGIFATVVVALSCTAGSAMAVNPASPVENWTKKSPATNPPERMYASMAFDPAEGNTVMFGGQIRDQFDNGTWTWDGSNWTEKSPATVPSGRSLASMAFDQKNGSVLMFGGTTSNSGNVTNETWTWNGSNWNLVNPTTKPSARGAASMAYDAANGEMVLFGGLDGNPKGDTWTWNGSNWTQESPATSPPARWGATLTFDPSTGNTVLFGGAGQSGYLNDTWIWDGSNWSQRSPAAKPAAYFYGSSAFHPTLGAVVLYTRSNNPNVYESWAWDGSNWKKLNPQNVPNAYHGSAMAFDAGRGEIVMFAETGDFDRSETWTYGPPAGLGSAWIEQSPAASPPGLNNAGSTFDQSTGSTVLFGGIRSGALNSTYSWNGARWFQESPTTTPSARWYPGLEYDPAAGQTLLYSGVSPSSGSFTENDTWTWSGTNWTQLSPATSPSARTQFGLGFDPSMGKILIFGGSNSQATLDDTWTWNGATWTQLSPADSPSNRMGTSMAFDQSTGEMVLFGGGSDETWIWTGTNWIQKSPANSPSPRYQPEMDFDPTAGHVVLFGGRSLDNSPLRDTWIWNGTTWIEQTEATGPAGGGPTMNFDPNSQGMVLFGGYDGNSLQSNTWTYELVADSPTATITSPATGGTYTVDGTILTSFSCDEGSGGPGIASCQDSNGDTSPGELDTSTPGTHTYSVKATSENGLTGGAQISYEVVKAEPTLAISDPSSGVFGAAQLSADAVLASGADPTGTIEFRAYGPDDQDCSKDPAISFSNPAINGNGTYSVPPQDPSAPGEYRWVASYSGDEDNEPIETICGAPDSVSTIEKANPALKTVSATSNVVGEPVTVTVALTGTVEGSGSITYRAYGPDDPVCSGSPHFTSSPVPVPGTVDQLDVPFESPPMVTQALGEYRWVAEYSGNFANEPASTACGAPNSISTVSNPEPPVCPAIKLGFQIKTFKPNPKAINRQVPGVRITVSTGSNVEADIRPSYRYSIHGKTMTTSLQTRTVQVKGQRRFLFGVPGKMARQIRKATGHVSRNLVTFRLGATLRIQGANKACDQDAGTKTLRTRVSGVSAKTALRSRLW